jgi:hypothetical protein
MQAVTEQAYRWQASSHRHLFQAGSSVMVQPSVGAGLPAMQAVIGQALSLASQLPQAPVSSRQQHDGSAFCGSGLARDAGGDWSGLIAGKPAPTGTCFKQTAA